MEKSYLRTENNKLHVLKTLNWLLDSLEPLQIWKVAKEDNHKIRLDARITGLIEEEDLIEVQLEQNALLRVEEDANIYVHGDYKSILFKTNFSHQVDNKKYFKIPESIHLLELRSHDRFRCSINAPISLTQGDLMTTFHCYLFDVSKMGISFLAPISVLNDINKAEPFILKTLNPSVVPFEVKGSIAWSVKESNGLFFKIGVRLENGLPDRVIDILKNMASDSDELVEQLKQEQRDSLEGSTRVKFNIKRGDHTYYRDAELIDLSNSGACISIINPGELGLRAGDSINIDKIGTLGFAKTVVATVMHGQPFIKEEGSWKYSLKFMESLQAA